MDAVGCFLPPLRSFQGSCLGVKVRILGLIFPIHHFATGLLLHPSHLCHFNALLAKAFQQSLLAG